MVSPLGDILLIRAILLACMRSGSPFGLAILTLVQETVAEHHGALEGVRAAFWGLTGFMLSGELQVSHGAYTRYHDRCALLP